MKVCTRCKQQTSKTTDAFCRKCGNELENSVHCCDNELGPKDSHCPTCGEERPKFQSEIDREEWERKYLDEKAKQETKSTGCLALLILILVILSFIFVNGICAFLGLEVWRLR